MHITAGCRILAVTAYLECHNKVADVIYRNICAKYGFEDPGSKWVTPPKMTENN